MQLYFDILVYPKFMPENDLIQSYTPHSHLEVEGFLNIQ